MKTSLKSLISLTSALLILMAFGISQAQDANEAVTQEAAVEANASDTAATVPQIAYTIAVDANGVDQVYQLLLNGSEPRQITFAESDVITFGAAYDGLGLAYISDRQLWLQPIHTEEAEALAAFSADDFFVNPVFSPDGNYIAYADQGVWLVDLATRETAQILEDVPFDTVTLNTEDVRHYLPERFVVHPETGTVKLVVSINHYEYLTTGVFDLRTSALQELDAAAHNKLLALADGRMLIYGNNGITGEESLEIAASADDLTDAELLLDLKSLPGYRETYGAMFVHDAVEITSETLRVFFYPLQVNPVPADGLYVYYFDFDLAGGSASEVQQIKLGDLQYSGDTVVGPVSPDGSQVAVYSGYAVSDTGTEAGSLQLYDLTTGEATDDVFPDRVGEFQWQPLMPEALQQ